MEWRIMDGARTQLRAPARASLAVLALLLASCSGQGDGAEREQAGHDAGSGPDGAPATPEDGGPSAAQDAALREPDAGESLPACPPGEGPSIVAVEGDRTHGATLRVHGCRFGEKRSAPPLLYDTVDNQPAYAELSAGDVIPTDGDAPWTVNDGPWSYPVRFATDDPRGRRSAFYRVGTETDGGDGALHWPRALGGDAPPPEQRTLYVSWWYRPSMDPGHEGGSNKFIRIWDDEGGEGTRMSWTHMHLTYNGAALTAWRQWTENGRAGEWNRMEIYVSSDEPVIRCYVNGIYQEFTNASAPSPLALDDFVKEPDFDDIGLNIGVLGFDHGGSDYQDMISDFGEIYADDTQARVEISDQPTWELARHREIQVPSAWSGDHIELLLDEGTLGGLAGRYLYVVDAQGRVNAEGFEL